MARPKGDHEARRTDVAEATYRVIGREGIEGASLRRIATELGVTTGVLSHYFGNKDELLFFALEIFYERIQETMLDATEAHSSATARLIAAVTTPLPVDEDRRMGWRILFAFQNRALSKIELSERYNEKYEGLLRLVADLIEPLQREGRIDPDADLMTEAARLVSIVDGVGFHGLVHPHRLNGDMLAPIVENFILNTMLKRD